MRWKITIVTGSTMKVLCVFVLVAAIALVQGRSGVLRNESTPAQRGDNPSHVHLRFAQSNGSIGSCGATIIDNRGSSTWLLTTARCIQSATFVWSRYGTVQVEHPELVTESGAATLRPNPQYDGVYNDLALINVNRHVRTTDGIRPVDLESSSEAENNLPEEIVPWCSWGASDVLTCSRLSSADVVPCPTVGGPYSYDNLCSIGSVPSDSDIGTPLIVDNKLVAVLSSLSAGSEDGVNSNFAVYTRVGKFISWIESETGLEFDRRPEEEVEVAPLP